MEAKKYYRKWLIRAPLGLILIGLGVSLVAEAAALKYDHAPVLEWVIAGTISLVILNSGVSLVGDAVLQRTRYERAKERESSSESL
jgi:hypothetical protein